VTGWLRLAVRYVPRSLVRGGRRAAVTLLCVAVGVAAVVALQVASLSVADALTSNVRAANGGDLALASNSAPLSSADLSIVRELAASGVITRWSAISRVHATASTADGHLVPFDAAVVDTSTYPVGGQPAFVSPAGGSVQGLLRSPGDVLVSSVLADELGVRPGSRLAVTGVGGPGLQATVRGVLAQASLEHAAVMEVRRADAAALTSAPPQYVNVDANLAGDPASTAARLRQSFPQASITTVAEAVANAQQEVHDFHTFALLAGLVALLVAGVGIHNAMQSALASRVTEVAMLEALGNPPALVGGLFAVEAAILGLAGGLLGTGAGLAVSNVVTAAVARATGLAATTHIDAGVVLEGIGLGLGATVLFSLVPISGAVAVRPLGLMRGEVLPVRRSAPRLGGLLLLVVALFTVLASGVTGDPTASVLMVAGGLAVCGALAVVFAALVGALARLRRPAHTATVVGATVVVGAAVAVTVPRAPAAAPLGLLVLGVWAAAALGPQRMRLWLLMAGRGLDRRRTRTAVTIVALFTGALSAGLTMTMASGLHEQITQAIASSTATNLVAVATQPTRNALLENAARLPGVRESTATVIASGRAAAIDGRPVSAAAAPSPTDDPGEERLRALNGVTGYRLASGTVPVAITVTQGRALGAGDAGTANVLVDQSLAAPPASLRPGSTVTLADSTTGNRVTLAVVGLYQRSRLRSPLTSRYSPRVLGDESAAWRLAGGDVETVLGMAVAPDHLDRDSVILQRAVPSALVANVNDLTVVVRTVLDNLLLVLIVVTSMVVLAGVAVVANSVTLALLERAREVALLRAVGFGPGHVLTLVVLEYGLAGLLASAAAVLSIATALALLSRLVLQTPIAVSAGISAALVASAVLVTGLTAWLAARSGASVRPLTALRNS
jgi:putative ABC transport system permease protein